MMKIYFISDFFAEHVPGGAELVDCEVIKYFTSKGYEVKKIRSFDIKEIKKSFLDTGYYIISNFVGLSDEIKSDFSNHRYSIYEHDHKYLTTRDPSVFKDFKAPQSEIIDRFFYANAENVFCQSKKHKEVIENNLKLSNIVNLGCSLWSSEELDSLEVACQIPKTKEAVILKSDNQIKGTIDSINFCHSKGINFDLVGDMPFPDFVTEMAKYEKFIFFPKVLESFSRIAVESRILGCQLVTNKNLGCTSEPWFRERKGKELLRFVKEQQQKVLSKVEDMTVLSDIPAHVESEPEEITVILNSYRRPYNLKMQVDAIRQQTTKPTQIWLWVNDHEDNRGFDYTTLDIDRIFQNNYNWKFYGRFAAALLADTKYVAIFDDDTIPGNQWFGNCLETMKTSEGILGSAGVILDDKYYIQHTRAGWPTQNLETTQVDLVGHAWFFKREWLQYLWREMPTTWDNGEDIQFSYLAQKYGNIQTYCPPHPPSDKSLHGSVLGNELGIDDKATSTNGAVSHQQFFSERDLCVQNALKGGWNTVRNVTL